MMNQYFMPRDPTIITELQQIQWFEKYFQKVKNNTVYCIFSGSPENVIGVWKLQDLIIPTDAQRWEWIYSENSEKVSD